MACEKDEPEPFTYPWAAKQLGLSVRTIATLVKTGRIGYVATGRYRRIHEEHIKAYKRMNEHKPKRGRKATGATY